MAKADALIEAHARLDSGKTVTLGVNDAAKPAVAALLWKRARQPVLLVVARESDAETYVDQLAAWTTSSGLVSATHFPARALLPYGREDVTADATLRRIALLTRLTHDRDASYIPLIVASVSAISEYTLAPSDLGRGPGTVPTGTELSIEELSVELVRSGYTMEPLVESAGQAARRGGLIDLFPPQEQEPVRIEFVGSKVESLRSFDAETQRTTRRLESVHIGPATEWFPRAETLVHLADRVQGSQEPSSESQDELASLRRGELTVPSLYGPLSGSSTIFDHLSPETLLIVDESEGITEALTDQDKLARERLETLIQIGEIGSGTPLPHASKTSVEVGLDSIQARVQLSRWATGKEANSIRLPFTPSDSYAGRLPDAAADAKRQLRRGDRIVVVTQQAHRYREVLAEEGIGTDVSESLADSSESGSLDLIQGELDEGWRLPTPQGLLTLTTDRNLFGFVKQRRRLRPHGSHRSLFLSNVQPGDFVVHADHGIARFAGVVRREVDQEQRDYMELRYASDDRLYVPTQQANRVSLYSGPSQHAPRLTRLGTQEWNRTRSRVREAVSIVASDLVRLYAARQLLSGHSFPSDTAWQQELEAAFPYEETDDQRQAIDAVKHDMEDARPMDRVICGDVGFGKTEVALRAAFKAVNDGFQAAVLVPTTVLAQQHERTFRQRLAAFPIQVEVLSRFRSDADARSVIGRLRDGEVDIVIGTHRLLSADVQFHNLGLVIIDEEQRFGVTHKERLKRMRLEVDVLTLSATPIPRTLHMALTGIRDMSAIDDPPEGRRPVQTFVTQWDEGVVREAIVHEIDRGGQVYAVHNRVQSIEDFADQLRVIVPDARIVIGHGQMPEQVLKSVMERFSNGDFDVLVCTTIIESGIDIPNVNTMIIDQSNRLGLGQLYQLRGRVGRSLQQAYAYLLHPRDRVLTEVEQERLSTIFEATEPGSGYQVAMRDLEIRGAGNLLGSEQSGQIAAVGFDLYTGMLGEAVESLKAAQEGRDPDHSPQKRPRVVDLPVTAYVPESYIEDVEGRLALYQRISALTTIEQLHELESETRDRFGSLPKALEQLLLLVHIRLVAASAGIESVRVDGTEVVLTSDTEHPFSNRTLPTLPPEVRTGPTQLRIGYRNLGEDWLSEIETLLKLLSDEPVPVPT